LTQRPLARTETARLRGPFPKPRRDHVGDDAADITLLRWVVVGSGVVARHGHRPAFVLALQPLQEARRVIDVASRIEHVAGTAKLVSMIVEVDLHAAEVDQLATFAPRALELLQ